MAVGGRTIALFPGAFRPPHINHFETVRRLARCPDVDEVVVIITNRCRSVPGTSKVLDVDVAEGVWSIYLRRIPNVRVEVAAASAVAHALDYVEGASPGDTILLVVGRKEARQGRGRFAKLRTRDRAPNVTVTVVEGALEVMAVEAADLRAMLALGDRGRAGFVAALPAHLEPAERERVWGLCRRSMVDRRQLTVGRIHTILDRRCLLPEGDIVAVNPGKRDEIYMATLRGNGRCYIKHANDSVASDKVTPDERKPRRRLKAEREAIKWLHRHVVSPVRIPEVICHDRTSRTLVLSQVLEGAHHLADDLRDCTFDPLVGATAAHFLAAAHRSRDVPEPFWDDPRRDLDHWRTMLAVRTTGIEHPMLPSGLRSGLRRLSEAADAAKTNGFRHLDFSARNILVRGRMVGAIDFELSANVGDPAYDIGTILGHYLLSGLTGDDPGGCRAVLALTVRCYERGLGERWNEMASRVAGFSAASLLHLATSETSGRIPSGLDERIIAAASHLLSIPPEGGQCRVSDALAEALEIGERAGRHQGRVRAKSSGRTRTIRRRSLRAQDPGSTWEGSVSRFSGRHDVKIEIFGGEPRAMVEIYLDGSCIDSTDLDALGATTLTLGTGQVISKVEIRSRSGTVLDGRAPGDRY